MHPIPLPFSKWHIRLARLGLAIAAAVVFSRWWCARDAADVWQGNLTTHKAMAAGVEHWLKADLKTEGFASGSNLYNGEWLFGSLVMSGLGLIQSAWEHPELREVNIVRVRLAVEKLLSPEARAFDAHEWKEDAIDTLDTGKGDHAAYLDYFNLLLACQQIIDPEAPNAQLHERISQALTRRLEASPFGLLQTYPRQCYPLDNASGIASLALRDRTRSGVISPAVQRWMDAYRTRWIDSKHGLLIQAVDYRNGQAIDFPRGSGTGLGAYFLSFADTDLSRKLYRAANQELACSNLGFTALREYPRGINGRGDIDSGPLVNGLSISATGFSLAGCRQHGTVDEFTERWRLVHLLGVPAQAGGEYHFIMGGRLGDAILCAMCTAVRPEILNRELTRHHP